MQTRFIKRRFLKLQNQEKIATTKKMQKLLSFTISTKLINLIKQNDEKLGEVLKILETIQER
ncbi:unnamed protein product [Paramecium pentaurelia]|uniref:Uncharacterized protein n=1 Tax=Paramecium pentaurelia TaxID=43138 RepID=A0A8S1TPK8_9CILI|nr:unnamed protein product [Paramecium pentaurelia]